MQMPLGLSELGRIMIGRCDSPGWRVTPEPVISRERSCARPGRRGACHLFASAIALVGARIRATPLARLRWAPTRLPR
jgi:hypothetical protein